MVAAVLAVYAANTYAWNVPLVGDTRLAILAVGIVGLGMCIVASDPSVITSRTAYSWAANALGALALGLVVVGLITGWAPALTALVAVTALLYVAATVRHLVRERTAIVPV
jgi:hypothetical protein